ncbi:MAG: hypothetical protein K2N36_00660 [Ruminiclostridium sp.]|nr:hypothetical protein [Ruminiclostridium sp.]
MGVICVIELVHFILYLHFGLVKSQDYRDEFVDNMDIVALINKEAHYIDFVSYDDLSWKYRNSISKEMFQNAKNDEQSLLIYNQIISATHDPQKSESFFTTKGMDMCTGYEGLIVDGKTYYIEHDIDVKTNYFTFKPYISKWMISIKETT